MRARLFTLVALLFLMVISSNQGCQKETVEPINDIEQDTLTNPIIEESAVDTVEIDTPSVVVPNPGPVFNPTSGMPAFNALYHNYLQYGPHLGYNSVSDQDFAAIVGGLFQVNVDSGFFANTCASRVSHALNMGGHSIPYMSGRTSSGGNGFKYIFRVIDLRNYMNTAFGPADVIGTDMNDFIGKKGIIIFNTQGLWTDASGHATIWNETVALGGNYANNPSYYFANSVSISLWEAE